MEGDLARDAALPALGVLGCCICSGVGSEVSVSLQITFHLARDADLQIKDLKNTWKVIWRETLPSPRSWDAVSARGSGVNNYFTEMCSGSEAGSCLRLIDFVCHSTLGHIQFRWIRTHIQSQ